MEAEQEVAMAGHHPAEVAMAAPEDMVARPRPDMDSNSRAVVTEVGAEAEAVPRPVAAMEANHIRHRQLREDTVRLPNTPRAVAKTGPPPPAAVRYVSMIFVIVYLYLYVYLSIYYVIITWQYFVIPKIQTDPRLSSTYSSTGIFGHHRIEKYFNSSDLSPPSPLRQQIEICATL